MLGDWGEYFCCKDQLKKCVAIMLCIVFFAFIFITFPMGNAVAYTEESGATQTDEFLEIAEEIIEWKKVSEGDTENLFSFPFLEDAGASSVDWYAVALGRLGYPDDYNAYLAMVEQDVKKRYQTTGGLDEIKATEWHRIALAVLSCGGDPTNLADGSIDLVADGSYNRGKKAALDAQGTNALFWGLILMDAMRYQIPEGAYDSREDILVSILEVQKPDGSFGEADMTAMALQALAPYYNSEKIYEYIREEDGSSCRQTVRAAIDDALAFLSKEQQENGGFLSGDEESCESSAQVIIALCSLGIDPASDSRFLKSGGSVVDAMLAFQQEDGGFAHTMGTSKQASITEAGTSNAMASEQALLALTALIRYEQRLRNVFDFRMEPNDGIKNQIITLENEIEQLKTAPDAQTAAVLYASYLVIPVEERSYVRNYAALSQVMDEFGISKETEHLVDAMNQNTGGDGAIVPLFGGEMNEILHFTEEDAQSAMNLGGSSVMEDSAAIAILLRKLQKSENRADYADVEAYLLEKQEEVQNLETEIDEINTQISALYPIEEVTLEDYDQVYAIIERIEALAPADRTAISGFEDIAAAKEKVDSMRNTQILIIILIAAGAAFAALLVWKRYSRRKYREK